MPAVMVLLQFAQESSNTEQINGRGVVCAALGGSRCVCNKTSQQTSRMLASTAVEVVLAAGEGGGTHTMLVLGLPVA